MKPPKVLELLEKINRIANNTDFSMAGKLEIDLLQQHLRNLYDELDSLKNQPASNTNKGNTETETPVTVSKRVLNPNQNLLITNTTEEKNQQQTPVNTTPVVNKTAETATKPIQEPIKQEIANKTTPTAKSTINELVQSVSSLNEKHKPAGGEIHRKLSSKPLKDLIDLNKKFTLLAELFKGNAEAYSAAIQHIDTLPDFDSAESFIKNELSSNYFWDEKSQTARMFMKLVKQKFGVE